MLVWYFPRLRSSLLNIIDRRMQQLFSGGLIEYYDSEYKDLVKLKRYEHLQEPKGAKVLTMKHLQAGFVVWMITVTIAIFVFLFEWIYRLSKNLLFMFIISLFFKQEQLKLIKMRALIESRLAAKKLVDSTVVLSEFLIDLEPGKQVDGQNV